MRSTIRRDSYTRTKTERENRRYKKENKELLVSKELYQNKEFVEKQRSMGYICVTL